MSIPVFILTVVIMPMLVTEFTDWLPWFAGRMVRAAARTLPPAARERYADEWLAELDAEPGGSLSKLLFAVRVCLRVRATGNAIRGAEPRLRMAVKRIFDQAIAAALLVWLAPVLAFIALVVRLEDGGPAFALETRVGKDGRTFRMYKFRTTVVPAETTVRREILSGSPRMTVVGAMLRRWHLDELPQVINVLAGDMSMVGPCPALRSCPQHAANARHEARPYGLVAAHETQRPDMG